MRQSLGAATAGLVYIYNFAREAFPVHEIMTRLLCLFIDTSPDFLKMVQSNSLSRQRSSWRTACKFGTRKRESCSEDFEGAVLIGQLMAVRVLLKGQVGGETKFNVGRCIRHGVQSFVRSCSFLFLFLSRQCRLVCHSIVSHFRIDSGPCPVF